jgi:hypothetical protein
MRDTLKAAEIIGSLLKNHIALYCAILLILTSCGVDLTEPKVQPVYGDAFKISITTKVRAVYTITPQGDVRFSKVETEATLDSTEIKTLYYLNRIKTDSISITITKDGKLLFGKIFNKYNVIIKEFIMDNGNETRIIKF